MHIHYCTVPANFILVECVQRTKIKISSNALTRRYCIDKLQLTSSFSRQKHWTAKRASFFHSLGLHVLNMKRCGGRDGRVEKCGGGVRKCVGLWGRWGLWKMWGRCGVWESVLRCGKVCWEEVRKSRGSGKIWHRCGKVFWVWGRGVGKFVGV